jgi:hypothetical protein
MIASGLDAPAGGPPSVEVGACDGDRCDASVMREGGARDRLELRREHAGWRVRLDLGPR